MIEKLRTEKILFIFVIVLSLILIAYTFEELIELRHLDWYSAMFSGTPDWAVLLRYSASVARRVLLVIAAAGVIFRFELCRKVLIFIAWFNVLTIYWRHPYSAFVNIAHYFGESPTHSVILKRMLSAYYMDFMIALIILMLLNNSKVKLMFKPKEKK
jgi:hypothetical protein